MHHPHKSDAAAQAGLGALYHDGKGVPQSYERAAELFTQAADKGHAGAQAGLGGLYYKGLGVPKDVARAVALLKQAAAGRQGGGEVCGPKLCGLSA